MSVTKNLLINGKKSIKKTMSLIDNNGWGIVFVVSEKNILRGVVTDGDIRRAIGEGLDINSAVETIMNDQPLKISGSLKKNRLSQSTLRQINKIGKKIGEELDIITIPVVNSKNQVISFVVWTPENKKLKLVGRKTKKRNGIKKILLVGGAGYLGTVLSHLLLKSGYKVRVLDLLLFGRDSVEKLLDDPNFDLVVGDLRDTKKLHQALDGVEAVIHLAAIVGDPASQKSPQETIAVNYLATMNLALACKYFQINKFLYASTCSVYGASDKKIDENSQLNPVSLYARTKIESEKGIISLADENFKPIILRMGTLYGLSPRMRFDLVVNIFAKMATVNQKITIFNGGTHWRPLLHVKDAAKAFVASLQQDTLDQPNGSIYNVGSDKQNYSIKMLGKLVKKVLPKTKVQIEKNNAKNLDKRTYKVSFDKIQEQLKFKPKHTVEKSLLSIHKAILSGRLDDIENKRYYNHVI